jgi:hypothetical protein
MLSAGATWQAPPVLGRVDRGRGAGVVAGVRAGPGDALAVADGLPAAAETGVAAAVETGAATGCSAGW